MPISTRRCRLTMEPLESRCLLAADIYISEFMAINDSGPLDENGDDSDWIELYNAGPDDADLTHYFLTDNADKLAKWRLPPETLAAGNHLLVFASSKDRREPGEPYHTNFKLSGEGEYLALTQRDPDDANSVLIVSEFSPDYGRQFGDVSYGTGQDVEVVSVVESTGSSKLFFPTDDTLGDAWIAADFDDASWTDGTLAVGYQRTQPGLLVEDAKAVGRIDNLADALAVLDGEGQLSRTVIVSPTINFHDPEGGGGETDFAPNDSPFPNDTPEDDNDFAVRATGTITIPTSGTWGFGAVSDDGVSIKIGEEFVHRDDRQRPAELGFGLVDLAAGDYPIEVVYFERGGPAELELLAGTDGPSLVGDIAKGGLAVRTGSTVRGLSEHIVTDSTLEMVERTSSVYLRSSFEVDQNALPESLTLTMQYDGGFVAYLNGTEIARRNVESEVQFDSLASTRRADHLITKTEAIDISSHLALLQAGENVLAIHGMNDSLDSDEFLLTASIAEINVAATSEFYFTSPTPGGFNPAVGVDGFLTDEISFSQSHGFYDSAFDVAITAATEGTSIRYTIDGSAPTVENGVDYTQPIQIEETTTLRARAFQGERAPSFTETATYVFLADVINQSSDGSAPLGFPTSRNINGQSLDYGMDPDIVNDEQWGPQLLEALTQVPSMSLVMDVDDFVGQENGIYTNAQSHGRAWERPASLELIYPDGTEGFQINAGVRVRGGFSRTGENPKHAFRMFFRDDYGDGQLEYPLFGDEGVSEFQKIDLRTTQNYSWAFNGDTRNNFMRDVFARDAQGEMGQPHTRSEYYHLYLNGQYWGLFQTQERAEANHAAAYFGGSADDYDVIKSAGGSGGYVNEATDGDMEAYGRLAELFYQDGGLGDANMESYWQSQGMNADGTRNSDSERLLDVDNLIDYAALLYYTGDRDGPVSRFVPERVNNYYGVYNREDPDGFKFFEHDSEHSLDTGDTSLVTPITSSGEQFEFFNPQWMHEQLVTSNSEYRLKFADRIYEHYFDDGILTTENSQERIDSRAAEIDMAIIAESARWGDAKNSNPFDKNDWERSVEITRSWFDDRGDLVLDQFRDQGWFNFAAPPVVNVDGLSTRNGEVYTNSEIQLISSSQVLHTELISSESTWKYLDDGSDQRSQWIVDNFDDVAWSEGDAQFGYGEDDENTIVSVREEQELNPVTIYFRKQIEVDQAFDSLTVRLLKDDAAIVYVNGVEVVRDNMPEGEIGFETLATQAVPRRDENVFFDFDIDPDMLRSGSNTIAVEVHQSSSRVGGDMSFDLELIGGTNDPNAGTLFYTLDGSDPRLAGGEPNPTAIAYDGSSLEIGAADRVLARTLVNNEWSSLGFANFARVDGLLGDVNSDGIVDGTDIDAIAAAIGLPDEPSDVERYDLNRDDLVDADDMDFLIEDILKTRRGDTNLDRRVDFTDFLALSLNFGSADADDGNWADGNSDANRIVDFADFLAMSENFGFGT